MVERVGFLSFIGKMKNVRYVPRTVSCKTGSGGTTFFFGGGVGLNGGQ